MQNETKLRDATKILECLDEIGEAETRLEEIIGEGRLFEGDQKAIYAFYDAMWWMACAHGREWAEIEKKPVAELDGYVIEVFMDWHAEIERKGLECVKDWGELTDADEAAMAKAQRGNR